MADPDGGGSGIRTPPPTIPIWDHFHAVISRFKLSGMNCDKMSLRLLIWIILDPPLLQWLRQHNLSSLDNPGSSTVTVATAAHSFWFSRFPPLDQIFIQFSKLNISGFQIRVLQRDQWENIQTITWQSKVANKFRRCSIFLWSTTLINSLLSCQWAFTTKTAWFPFFLHEDIPEVINKTFNIFWKTLTWTWKTLTWTWKTLNWTWTTRFYVLFVSFLLKITWTRSIFFFV